MIADLLCILEKYQTLFVGLIGFAGVIATLFQNARLNRKQHERDNLHERTTLRQAMISELRILEETFEDRSKTKASGEFQDWLVPARVSDSVYQAFLPRIGILTKEEVSSVMRAYVLVSELPRRLRLLSPKANYGREDDEYIFVERNLIEVAAGIHKVFLKEVRNALSELESHERKSL